jgi:hypothetical protein
MTPRVRSAVFLLVGLCAAISASAFDAGDRQIEPTQRVGAITETCSEADLIRIYGAAAVTRVKLPGAATEDTVLFAGTPDQVRIEWKVGTRSPRRIVIDGGAWMTSEGVVIGMPLKALEEVNGGPFDVTGANWDLPVRVVSWKGGKLPPLLQVDLVPSKAEAAFPPKLNSQRNFFESTSPLLRNSDLVVKRMILEW